MKRNDTIWAGTFRVAIENLIHGATDEDRFRAQRLLQQYMDGYEVPDHEVIREAWDAQSPLTALKESQEAENND